MTTKTRMSNLNRIPREKLIAMVEKKISALEKKLDAAKSPVNKSQANAARKKHNEKRSKEFAAFRTKLSAAGKRLLNLSDAKLAEILYANYYNDGRYCGLQKLLPKIPPNHEFDENEFWSKKHGGDAVISIERHIRNLKGRLAILRATEQILALLEGTA